MKNLSLQVLYLCLFPFSVFAQKMDHLASFRTSQQERYLRLNYDNDLFTSTDQNYSQGINLELVAPVLEKNPLNFLFLKPKSTQVNYGLALEHLCYTPQNIQSSEIQVGNRPFAAAFFLKSFRVSDDSLSKSHFVSSLSLGILGPAAFGKEMQTAIHKATKNLIPGGWHNQIGNDCVLNYTLSYEKQLLAYRNVFSLQSNSEIELGTLFTNASLGFNTQLGRVNLPFAPAKNKVQVYFYFQLLARAIAYDASLQGGFLTTKNVYAVPFADINHVTLQCNYGLVVQIRKLYFEFGLTKLTAEIEHVKATGWGGVKLGFGL